MGMHVNRLKWCQPNFFTSVIPVKKIQLDEVHVTIHILSALCSHLFTQSESHNEGNGFINLDIQVTHENHINLMGGKERAL